MAVLLSSETSVLTRATWRNIPENGIFIANALRTSSLASGKLIYMRRRKKDFVR
jgi:hypothetical protein